MDPEWSNCKACLLRELQDFEVAAKMSGNWRSTRQGELQHEEHDVDVFHVCHPVIASKHVVELALMLQHIRPLHWDSLACL
jgi:hypothetical protein